jgi:hypothetical protein
LDECNQKLQILGSVEIQFNWYNYYMGIRTAVVAHMGRHGVKCIQGLMGKPKAKRPLGRPRHLWEDN